MLILVIFAFGFENISYAVVDFYQYDVITNIERDTPENVIFPAITICNIGSYQRVHYRNGSVIKTDPILFETDNISQISNYKFLRSTEFYSTETKSFLNVRNYLDFFIIPLKNEYATARECFRFNGVKNKSLELFKAISPLDTYRVTVNIFFIERISQNEYFYTTFDFPVLYVYIADNFLNSFEKLNHLAILLIDANKYNEIKMDKESIEIKLQEPFNPCRKYSLDNPYHQWNCIESCIYTTFKNKYNCTFPLTLFSIQGLKEWHKLW